MNLILGKAKTGKSKYIFDKLDEDIKLGKQVIYIVPSQMRVLSEENYIKFQNKPGMIDVNLTTIDSFIKDFLSKYNINHEDKYISKLDRKLILTKIMLENPKLFNIFSKVKNKEGFLESLNIYMDIFKKEEINVSKIKDLELDDKLLEYKLKEITCVYNEYLNYIEDKYIDSIDEKDIFLKLFEDVYKNKYIGNMSIYFDAYNNFTTHEFKFVKLLLKLGFDVTLSLTTDLAEKVEDITALSLDELKAVINEETVGIFTEANNTLIKILEYARKIGHHVSFELMRLNYSNAKEDIKYLANNIFMDDVKAKVKVENIHISLTTNIYTEVEKIANIISEKIREGYRYKDFAIYTTNTDEYSYVVKKIFYEYNIPVYIDSKISIESNIIAKYLQKLIEICKNGYKKENLFQILKFGLNEISTEDISYLENYVLEFNTDRFRFEKEFTYNNVSNGIVYDLERLNKIRETVLNIFSPLIKYFKTNHPTIDIIRKIYEHLVENKVLDNYTIIIDKMKNSDDPLVKYTGSVGYQMWDKLSEVFTSITKIYEDKEVSIEEFEKLIKYSLKDIKVKNIEPTIDEVQVLDVNTSKCETKKVIFFVSVNEDRLPKKIDDDLFFDDTELENLKNIDIEFKETSLHKLNMQLYNIYEIINNVEDEIYFSYLSSDTSGKSLRPSSLIVILKNITDAQVIGSVTSDENGEIYSRKAAFEKLIKLRNKEENITDEMLTLYRYVMMHSDLEDIIKYNRNSDNLGSDTLEVMNKKEFVTSVSRLEQFQKCPFSYFMKYGLKLNERKVFAISSLDIGSFMHSVLEKFSMYLFKNKVDWHEILLDKDKYTNILENIINEELDSNFSKHKENVKYIIFKQKLKSTMTKVIMVVAQSFNQSKFKPYGYEIEFKDGALFAPIEIDLENDKKMHIIGKIDRIDTLKVGDTTYARIVDYKSSSKDLKLEDIKEGLSLQLITYLSSFIDNVKDEKILPAGMMYFTLSEKLVNLKEYTNDESEITKQIIQSLRMKGIFIKDLEILDLMDNKLSEDSRLIDVSSRTVTSNRRSNKLLEKEEFESLCVEIKDILKSIGNDILSGNVKIKPNKKAKHCDFCEFSAICRKENLC